MRPAVPSRQLARATWQQRRRGPAGQRVGAGAVQGRRRAAAAAAAGAAGQEAQRRGASCAAHARLLLLPAVGGASRRALRGQPPGVLLEGALHLLVRGRVGVRLHGAAGRRLALAACPLAVAAAAAPPRRRLAPGRAKSGAHTVGRSPSISSPSPSSSAACTQGNQEEGSVSTGFLWLDRCTALEKGRGRARGPPWESQNGRRGMTCLPGAKLGPHAATNSGSKQVGWPNTVL